MFKTYNNKCNNQKPTTKPRKIAQEHTTASLGANYLRLDREKLHDGSLSAFEVN